MSPQEVIQLSEYVATNDLKDIILMMKSRYDVPSVIDFIESWARAGGYPYRHHVEEDRHSFVIQHELGERWSLFLVEIFRFAFEQLGTKIDFQHTPNTISFDIEC